MVAHNDEKVSHNRRRLFKALSAAPVVMTLRPGTAAASSAYQCVTNIRDESYLPFSGDLGPIPPNSNTNNYVIEDVDRRYWDAANGDPVGSQACDTVDANNGIPSTGYIVEYGNRFYAQGDDGRGGNPNELLNATVETTVAGDNLIITNSTGICYRISGPPAVGRWPLIVQSTEDSAGVPDTGIQLYNNDSSYPRRLLRLDGSTSAGENQLINGTCLCSVNPSASPLCSS